MLTVVWVWGTPAWRAGPSDTACPGGPMGTRVGSKQVDSTRWVKRNMFLAMAPVPLAPGALWKCPNLSPPTGNQASEKHLLLCFE